MRKLRPVISFWRGSALRAYQNTTTRCKHDVRAWSTQIRCLQLYQQSIKSTCVWLMRSLSFQQPVPNAIFLVPLRSSRLWRRGRSLLFIQLRVDDWCLFCFLPDRTCLYCSPAYQALTCYLLLITQSMSPCVNGLPSFLACLLSTARCSSCLPSLPPCPLPATNSGEGGYPMHARTQNWTGTGFLAADSHYWGSIHSFIYPTSIRHSHDVVI